ncbi:hypothetical protein Asppvi_004067 [Aspergillus pseudoviridinutans]|uniref:Uncharacterized protein n=1 Tax=Aspergillus pseudoviridinutans TaxID=1517512 RepID=A0A9P3ERD7_9EURO|nr:uncharacterized protein Asppvi_004067 [Aspergillus pseudoviridinutans]GIJ85211.1 hypothetical protein Asppvi_004067 [Aspergillus pseudoviridinutans]
MKEEEATPTMPASKPDEASVESQLLSSKQKELAAAVSSYVGFPERLMQKAGFYKYPFLFLVYLFAFLFGYYRTCQLRDAILRDAGEKLLRGSLK